MSTCQSCGGRATVSLCPTCVSKLRDLLEHLPQWITHLEEAAIGQVRLGDGGGGRSTSRREPFKGDDEVLARCACGHPEHEGRECGHVDREVIVSDNPDDGIEERLEFCICVEYRPIANQAKLRAQFLAAGRINTRAAELLDAVRNSLTTWTRHLGETRGIVFVRPGFIGPLLAGHVRLANTTPAVVGFLAENVGAIACDEAAGECLAELEDHVRAIEKVINRPLATKFLGNCPTWNERTRKNCGRQLSAREDAIETTCPDCRQTHNCNRLQLLMENDLERKKLTIREILKLKLPAEYQVNERTLRRWRKPGKKGEPPKLKPCGFRRGGEDGPLVINRHSEDDEPVYRWADVKRLRAERVERKVSA